jgi:hypothetical protein
LVKVKLNVWPLFIAGEVKLPSLALTVCAALSSNFQVTLVPTATVRSIGEKEKFLMSTVVAPAPEAAAEPPDIGIAVEAAAEPPEAAAALPPAAGLELDEQAAITTAAVKVAASAIANRRTRAVDQVDAMVAIRYAVNALGLTALSMPMNDSGTGYSPRMKLRIAACIVSTGWIDAAVMMPPASVTLAAAKV